MTKTTNWLSKPITSLCVCLFIIIASLFILINSNNKVEAEISSEYTITIRHYGIDMNEIQRTISIPLEDALSALDGVKNILSSSEDGRSRVFVLFNDKENKLICKSKKTGRYEALRDAVQRVYETLPPSVQRPEITAVNLSMNPVWVAAIVFKEDVKTANNILNKVIKPALSGLDGAANVEISGIGVNEIIISLKPEETASAHLNSVTIANFLSKNDIILPGGHLNNKESETMIMIDGRYESIEALRNTLIPLDNGAVVALKDIAEINENEREPDILSRLNGEKTVIISVLPVFGSDTGKLSNLIAQEVKKLKKYPVEFIIINDRGAEESAAFHSIVVASIQSVLALMIICALMMRKNGKVIWKSSIICAFFVPVSALISAAVLSLIGINFDKTTLAGLSLGLGSAIDSAILSAESFGKLDSINNGQNALKRLCPPLISGAFTTIIAFFPLVFMPMVSKMVIAIALSTAVVTFVSMILALWLCPPLFLWKTSKHNTTKIHIINSASLLSGFVSRINIHIEILKKIFMKILYNCIKKPHYVCIITLFILVVGLGSIILSKTNIDEPRSENSLFAQIEFPGGFRKEIIDNHLSEWSKKIKAYDGITNVQTSVSIGSASVLINFLPNIIKNENIREIVRNEPIPEGFIYINEAASNEKLWEIKIFGNSPDQCAEIAQEAANICSAIPAVKQTVYNFKDGSPYLFIEPDRERIAVQQNKNGFSFMQISQEVRNNIFGPVIYKKLDNNGDMAAEKDVRIKGLGVLSPSRDDIDKILITSPYNDTNIKLNTFVEKNYKTNKSSLRRENRRSLASISIRTKPEDPRKIRNLIMPKLSAIDLPQSYSIEFDREAVEKAELLSGTVYYFILSMLFCYIIIAISNESFLLPIAILSIIPPSVAIPMFVLFLLGFSFNTVSACAFIAVCGVAVNAAVLISDEIKVRFSNNTLTNELNRNRKYLILFGAIRKRIPNLLATSITTISSSIPYLFLNEGINLTIKTLSLISALGVAASFIFAIFFIPALAVLFPGFFAVKETK